ncbi:MAG TPA: nucleotide exchange factor GrpE [Cyclobacteriaceae bacterium]|nr:nucleotide exchange factor GrpE [Cyclobacteriaceae bacterium]
MEDTTQSENGAEKQAAEASAADGATTATAKDDTALAKLQDELAESKDKYLRLYAEFENHRRRTAKERLELIQSANEQLIKALLPVVDDFERAEKSLKELNGKEADGVLLIYQKLKKVLDQYGVKAMDAQGDFNPDLHEAITQVPDESKKGKVVDVVEKGYLLNDKVIRFAKVVVGC